MILMIWLVILWQTLKFCHLVRVFNESGSGPKLVTWMILSVWEHRLPLVDHSRLIWVNPSLG